MARIYDLFPYAGEKILDLRLRLLYDVVDFFVIGESNTDFKGNPKEYQFDPQEFAWAKNKIRYLKFDESDYETCVTTWDREEMAKDLLARGIADASDEDTILISDCDELLDPDKLRFSQESSIHIYELIHFRFFGDYGCVSHPIWNKTAGFRKILLDKYDISYLYLTHVHWLKDINAQEMTGREELRIIRVPFSGWHFSFLGGVPEITRKIKMFGSDFVNPSSIPDTSKPERMAKQIEVGLDILGRAWLWGKVDNFDFGNVVVKQWFFENDLLAPSHFRNYGNIQRYYRSAVNRPYFVKKIIFYLLRLKKLFWRLYANI